MSNGMFYTAIYATSYFLCSLRITVAKIQQSLPESKRSGSNVASSVLAGLIRTDKSNVKALAIETQLQSIPKLAQRLQDDPDKVVDEFEIIRSHGRRTHTCPQCTQHCCDSYQTVFSPLFSCWRCIQHAQASNHLGEDVWLVTRKFLVSFSLSAPTHLQGNDAGTATENCSGSQCPWREAKEEGRLYSYAKKFTQSVYVGHRCDDADH